MNIKCPQCAADVTQPDIPYAHKSASGNLMPGHIDIPIEIADLLWTVIPTGDEDDDPVSEHNADVITAYIYGKELRR